MDADHVQSPAPGLVADEGGMEVTIEGRLDVVENSRDRAPSGPERRDHDLGVPSGTDDDHRFAGPFGHGSGYTMLNASPGQKH